MCIIQSLHYLKVAGWILHKKGNSVFVLVNHEVFLFNCLKVDKWVFEVKITIECLKQEKTISEQHIKEKEHVLLVKINYVEDERHFLLE